jgi:hypothetical protein
VEGSGNQIHEVVAQFNTEFSVEGLGETIKTSFHSQE